jgi:putative tricarboxylic transport membrane protein
MKLSGRTFTRHQQVDLLVLLALSGLVTWYLRDAYSASSHFANLILILPVSIMVLLLCALDFIIQLRGLHKSPPRLEPVASMLPAIALFVLFVLSLEWLGFDVGTCIFIGAFLWLHGERRIKWILAYSISFALLISLFFSAMLPYPMPMLILPSTY